MSFDHLRDMIVERGMLVTKGLYGSGVEHLLVLPGVKAVWGTVSGSKRPCLFDCTANAMEDSLRKNLANQAWSDYREQMMLRIGELYDNMNGDAAKRFPQQLEINILSERGRGIDALGATYSLVARAETLIFSPRTWKLRWADQAYGNRVGIDLPMTVAEGIFAPIGVGQCTSIDMAMVIGRSRWTSSSTHPNTLTQKHASVSFDR